MKCLDASADQAPLFAWIQPVMRITLTQAFVEFRAQVLPRTPPSTLATVGVSCVHVGMTWSTKT